LNLALLGRVCKKKYHDFDKRRAIKTRELPGKFVRIRDHILLVLERNTLKKWAAKMDKNDKSDENNKRNFTPQNLENIL
jgi:hypothetical protein